MKPKLDSDNKNVLYWIYLVYFCLTEKNINQSEQVVKKEKILWIDKNPNLENLKTESCYQGMLLEDITR